MLSCGFNFSAQVCMYAVIHVTAHLIRLSIHDKRLFLHGCRTITSGYPITLLFLILIPPFACDFVKKRIRYVFLLGCLVYVDEGL